MKLLLYGASILRYGQPVMWQLVSTHEGLQLGVGALLSSHNTRPCCQRSFELCSEGSTWMLLDSSILSYRDNSSSQ